MEKTEEDQLELLNASSSVLFDALLSQTQDQVYFKDRKSRFVRASDAVAKKFGLASTTELEGKSDFDFFTEEHAQQSFDDEQQLMQNQEKLVNITEKETWPDGSVTWATSTKIPLYLGSGKVVGMMGITRDITAQVVAQQELEKNRALLKRKNEIMETDLDNARRVQIRLIPGPIPNLPFVDIAAHSLSMTEVNGDIITFPVASEKNMSFLLGDVSGHGASAGLFTVLVKHLADFYLPDHFEQLDRALKTLDERLTGLIPSGFVAVLLGSLRPLEKGRLLLTLANAGQPSALRYHRHSDTVEIVKLPSENVIGLGICGEVQCQSFEMDADDCFLFLSDGVVECRNLAGQEVGLEGLIDAFHRCAQKPAAVIAESILDFLRQFSADNFPQDDTSILVLKAKDSD